MTGQDGDEFVAVAEVVKAVGLRGEFKLHPLHDWYAPLIQSPYLQWHGDGEFAAATVRADGVCVVVGTADCTSREQAESLVGRQLGFLRSRYAEPAFPKPAGGLPFRYLGRPVVTADGVNIGTVGETRRYAAQIVLVIERGGEEVLVPAVEPILRADDGLTGPLVIDPPPGLIDAGATTDDAGR
jgi:16S rRNA processing protein RimM